MRGAVSREIGDGWNIQLDGLYRRANLDGVSADAVSGTAHGYFRRPEKYAVGAYLGTARAGSRTLSQLAALDFDQDMTAFSAGLEAAYFLSRTTLFAQADAGKIFLDDADLDEASAKAGARYYLSDNLRLDLEGAIKHWRADDARANGFSVATTAHYRLSQVPVSAFGGYRFENLSGKDDGGADIGGKSHGLLVGFRYHFGSTSLKDEERTGTLWSSPQGGF